MVIAAVLLFRKGQASRASKPLACTFSGCCFAVLRQLLAAIRPVNRYKPAMRLSRQAFEALRLKSANAQDLHSRAFDLHKSFVD